MWKTTGIYFLLCPPCPVVSGKFVFAISYYVLTVTQLLYSSMSSLYGMPVSNHEYTVSHIIMYIP